MRDPKRIKRICKLLEKLWMKHPDDRFGQLLINNGIIPDDNYVWHVEDDDVEAHLGGLYDKEK